MQNTVLSTSHYRSLLLAPTMMSIITQSQTQPFITKKGKTSPSALQKNVRKLEQNMKVQFSVNLIIWFKVLRKLVKLSLTVKTGQTMSC